MKKIFTSLILFILFISNIKAIDLNINSKYAYVYNLTEDKVMYEKNSNDEILVASMTKIMTAIIVIENNKNLNKYITIQDNDLRDWSSYTMTGFEKGNKVTIKELLYGILLKSGADSVNAAVRVTTDTEEEFINLMNKKVKELGLTHTHFSNAVGKDKDNYSSVSDMAKIMEYCLKNKTFKEIITTDMYYIERLNLQINGPLYKALDKYGVDTSIVSGGKTGFTPKAQNSMVSFSIKDGVEYIVVTAYTNNYINLLKDTEYIYNYFYDNYKYIDYNVNFDINVSDGKEETYNVNLDTNLYLDKSYDEKNITYKYNGVELLNFTHKKNSKIGEISLYYGDELIKKIPVKLDKNIKFKSESKSNNKIFPLFIVFIIIVLTFWFYKFIINKIKVLKKSSNKETYIEPVVEKLIQKENDANKKLSLLQSTTDINIFFENLRDGNYTNSDKEKFEHDFIDRCFQSIDFSDEDSLRDLYIKLKLYKHEMCISTINYYNRLFKYCIKEYINK